MRNHLRPEPTSGADRLREISRPRQRRCEEFSLTSHAQVGVAAVVQIGLCPFSRTAATGSSSRRPHWTGANFSGNWAMMPLLRKSAMDRISMWTRS